MLLPAVGQRKKKREKKGEQCERFIQVPAKMHVTRISLIVDKCSLFCFLIPQELNVVAHANVVANINSHSLFFKFLSILFYALNVSSHKISADVLKTLKNIEASLAR